MRFASSCSKFFEIFSYGHLQFSYCSLLTVQIHAKDTFFAQLVQVCVFEKQGFVFVGVTVRIRFMIISRC